MVFFLGDAWVFDIDFRKTNLDLTWTMFVTNHMAL